MRVHSLAALPLDIAENVASFLETTDFNALASVSHAMAASLVFNPPKTGMLILPPEELVARRLLYHRNPTRLAPLSWIEIARPWHVDLLIEFGLAEAVTCIRIRNQTQERTQIETLCTKLILFQNLTALDVSHTTICDVTSIGKMRQLRMLDVSYTQMTKATPLSSLIHLEEFICRGTRVPYMKCIEKMTALRRLEVTGCGSEPTLFPSMAALIKLQSLSVRNVSILSVSDLVGSCLNLLRLDVYDLHSRHLPDGLVVPVESFVQSFPQLEVINQVVGMDSARVLSTIPSLRVVQHELQADFESIVTLKMLEELHLCIRTSHPRINYQFLLDLPRLKCLSISLNHDYFEKQFIRRVFSPLLDVVGQLPLLESLHLDILITCDVFESQVQRFENLTTLTIRIHESAESLECLKYCRSLRSLTIEAYPPNVDLSVLGNLTQLEELRLTLTKLVDCELFFLTKLEYLKILCLNDLKRNSPPIESLSKLRQLAIESTNTQHGQTLGQLKRLVKLDIHQTNITDITPLLHLQFLQTVIIPPRADCHVLTEFDHPSLVHVLHPTRNCLWKSACDDCQ